MSSLPKQAPSFPSSSSSKQSASTAIPASSRPRPIGQRQDAGHNHIQSGNDGPSLRADDAPPEGQVEEATAEAETPSQPTTNFKPLFTLIEDTNSSDYHHPTVHYIFSDDDTELITEAALRVLETGQTSLPPAQNNTQHGGSTSSYEASSEMNPNMDRRPSALPPPLPGVKERFILLDIEPTATRTGGIAPSSAPDAALAGTSAGTTATMMSTSPAQKPAAATSFGYRIASAHSLTSDWQVLGASFSLAPTFDTPQQQEGNTSGDQATNTLMLRIEGTSGFPRDSLLSTGKDTAAATTREYQTLEEMMDQFDKRMSELRQIIETNGDYSPAAAATITGQAGALDDDDHDDHNNINNNDNDDENDKARGDADYDGSAPAGLQQRGGVRGKEAQELGGPEE